MQETPALHVTNGDVVAASVRESGVPGTVLPWRDVLTDGLVPALDAAALREVRADFLAAEYGAASAGDDMAARDCLLAEAAAADSEIVLWFEHDLYDQLQILQVLERLGGAPCRARLSLICIDRHPAVERFLGLGQLRPDQMAALYPSRVPVSAEAMSLAEKAWHAFTGADPSGYAGLLAGDLSALPFLEPALRRWCEEFPWTTDGLGRTERQALLRMVGGPAAPGELFRDNYAREDAPFLGDWGFWQRIAALLARDHPLAVCAPGPGFVYPPAVDYDEAFKAQRLRLTPHGGAVLKGEADALAGEDAARWYGGYRLEPTRVHWRWDPGIGRLAAVAPPGGGTSHGV